MPEGKHVVIPATEGAAFVVRRGETIKVVLAQVATVVTPETLLFKGQNDRIR